MTVDEVVVEMEKLIKLGYGSVVVYIMDSEWGVTPLDKDAVSLDDKNRVVLYGE